jgi:hypothetical protein
MEISFLRELAENINLSFRSHAETDKETLVNLLTKKISSEKADTVFKMYLTCFNAQEVAQVIKPKGMEEIVYAVEKFFKKTTNCTNCLYEVTVGARRCDVVLFLDNEITAIEVKSAQDQMKNAPLQLSYYATWANKVFLAFDSKHKRTIGKLNLAEKGIGLLEFNEGNVNLVKNASYEEKSPEYILSSMTYGYLRKVARKCNANTEGKKKDIAKSIVSKISTTEAKDVFKDFLRTRALR